MPTKSRRTAKIPAPPLATCYWVLPGQLLAGEHPTGGTAEETRARIKSLLAVGIDYFVDLTMSRELPDYSTDLPRGTQYHREAIRDHGLPKQEQMLRIIAAIEGALAAGRRIYVHCRAGIGRTGTVIGCLLAQRGRSGDEALRHLNELWQSTSRAKDWAYVPETDAQIAYVRAWGSPALDSARPPAQALRDRFHGALGGQAVGDALAAATQERAPGSFLPVEDMLGGGVFDLPPGAWSDDTAMALCLAESLLERDGFDARDQMQRYARWHEQGHLSATGQAAGATRSTMRALALAKWQRKLFCGSHDPSQLDPEPLSRVAPAVMFYYASPAEALRQSCEAARTTCQAPVVLDSCRFFAAVLHGALSGRSKADTLTPGSDILDVARLRRPVAALAAQAQEPRFRGAAGARIDGALAAALWAFRSTDSFRAGALQAVNLGGNSDVIAAAYGALAGAHYGSGAIPAAWSGALARPELIESFAERLLARALLG
jgi:ADP-ribosyl-[dinitrogen reductase] hydrolase